MVAPPAQPAGSLYDVVRRRAAEAGQVVAAIDGIAGPCGEGGGTEPEGPPRHITYAELHRAAERLAAALAAALQGAAGRDPNGPVLATSMQRGNAWYCTFLAAARLQVPVVALSRDLPDRGAELKRNAEILESHRPALVVVDEVAGVPTHAGATVHFRELWAAAHAESHPAPQVTATADAILCYNYTGGTTRASRCSRITHRMALHEVTHYPRVGELTPRDRVLQQHSLYWGASAFGEIDIALAFGCALVFCEAWGTDDVVSVIKKHSATCAGLVPSMLAAIEHADVPTLKLVFTWGEALQPVVAREWGRRVHLIDLLISTECWLSLYADWSRGCAGGSAPYAGPSGSVGRAALEPPRPAFRTVPGTRVRLRRVDEDGCGRSQSSSSSAQASVRTEPREAERGELLVAGPMVSPGYTDEVLNADAFEEDSSGVRWYCTKDCVERRDGGLAFVGRADDLVKVGGKWTDIRELEARLLAMEEVSEASICGRSAFVALRGMPSGLMPRLQAVLPQDFALFLVPKLPRSAATSKVDRQRLGLLLPSGPTEGRAQAEGRRCEEELASMLHWYWPLSLVAGGSLLRAGLGLPPACLLAGPDGGVLAGVLRTLAVRALGELSWRLPCLSFLLLPSWYLDGLTEALRDFPLGVHGVAILASTVVPTPTWGIVLAAPGMALAARRGRLLSWPLVSAVGFPCWVRDYGYWWKGQSWFALGRHFALTGWRKAGAPKCVKDRLASGASACRKARAWGAGRLGLTRECMWCRKTIFRRDGHVNPKVDKNWYCSACWGKWHRFSKQCDQCQAWVSSGRRREATNGSAAASSFLCARCDGRRPEAGGAGSSSSDARGTKREWTWNRRAIRLPPRAGPAAAGAARPPAPLEAAGPPAKVQRCDGGEAAAAAAAAAGSTGEGVRSRACEDGKAAAVASAGGAGDAESPAGGPAPAKVPRCSSGEPAASAPVAASSASEGGCLRPCEDRAAVAAACVAGDPASATVSRRDCEDGKAAAVASAGLAGGPGAARAPRCDCEEGTAGLAAACGGGPGPAEAHRKGGDDASAADAREAAPLPDAQQISVTDKSKEWSVIERSTGVSFNSRSDSLSCLDSLRHTKMTSALRRQVRKRLPRAALKRCTSFGDLLDEVNRLPTEEPPTAAARPQPGAGRQEHPVWGIMWHSNCKWVVQRRKPLPESVLRPVLQLLMERHSALRAELRDPYRFFGAVQRALSGLQVWRSVACRALAGPEARAPRLLPAGLVRGAGRVLGPAVSWSFLRAWPRAGAAQGCPPVPLEVLPRSPTLEEAEEKVWSVARKLWRPPFRAVLAPYGAEGSCEEGVLLHLAVTHMLSDGFCVVPLMSDLAALVARVEAGAEGLVEPLPSLPCMFEALEPRLMQTVSGTPCGDAAPHTTITMDPVFRPWGQTSFTEYGFIGQDVVQEIRRTARTLGVPEDVVILAIIGVALAWFEGNKTEPIAMIVPQRDGPSENEMVGLFADIRHLSVITGGLSFAGVAAQLHHVVKERLWWAPGLTNQCDLPMVNFEWTDFEENNGFVQHVRLMEGNGGTRHSMQVAVEQPSKDEWRMRVAFNVARVSTEAQRNEFFDCFHRSLAGFVWCPLDLVWPEEST